MDGKAGLSASPAIEFRVSLRPRPRQNGREDKSGWPQCFVLAFREHRQPPARPRCMQHSATRCRLFRLATLGRLQSADVADVVRLASASIGLQLDECVFVAVFNLSILTACMGGGTRSKPKCSVAVAVVAVAAAVVAVIVTVTVIARVAVSAIKGAGAEQPEADP
jgi:hypothetical protein